MDDLNITGPRVARIEDILSTDPAFVEKMGKKDRKVVTKKGEKFFFDLSYRVTEEIQRRKLEAYSIRKSDVMVIANEILNSGIATSPADGETPKDVTVGENAKVDPRSIPGVNETLSVLSLLISASQVAAYDKLEGHAARRKSLDNLVTEYAQALKK